MNGKFSENAKQIISGAIIAAKNFGHTYVGSEHILLGIAQYSECTAAKVLVSAGITKENIRSQIIGLSGTGYSVASKGEDMTPKCRKILMKASRLANDSGEDLVGTQHILLALLTEECVAKRIIEMEGVYPEQICSMIGGLDVMTEPFPDTYQPKPPKKVETPTVNETARDLTQAARNGEIPLMCGREKQEERLIRVLLRKTKNNPCLIGEAGVGKTAVVESLARRIAEGNVPDALKNSRIMSLEMASVVAGTKYRGEFEDKLKKIINEAKIDRNLILFVDEIHTVVGAGSAEGSVDAANILKPPLARGEIRLIGATTPKEYKKSIEADSALERRFQPIEISEPTAEECVKMLTAVKNTFEAHHGLSLSDDAVKESVRISAKYIHDRYLPDKAIDLLDEAASFKRLQKHHKSVVTPKDIQLIAEEATGIPIRTLTRSDAEELTLLSEKLKETVIGQDQAVTAVCDAVKRAKTVTGDWDKPLCTLVFSGSGGVGKSLCCKTLASVVFGGEKKLIRLDMSEFSEPHSVSRLIGSPPGYIGYGQGGVLTEKIRKQPFSLILFDKIEQAHPDVLSMIYDILENGSLTDAMGLSVSFRSCFVIIATSPTGARAVTGFSNNSSSRQFQSNQALFELADDIVYFSPLSPSALKQIALRQIDAFCSYPKLIPDESYEKYIEEIASSATATAKTVCTAVRRDCGNAVANAFVNGSGEREIYLSHQKKSVFA